MDLSHGTREPQDHHSLKMVMSLTVSQETILFPTLDVIEISLMLKRVLVRLLLMGRNTLILLSHGLFPKNNLKLQRPLQTTVSLILVLMLMSRTHLQ